MAKTIGLKVKGFEELRSKLDHKKFSKLLKRNVRKAQRRNSLAAEGEMKRRIDAGRSLAKNSPITVAIKGSSRPLVDGGDLKASINHLLVRWDLAFIGVLRTKKVSDENGRTHDLLNIAFILHEGATIKVTQRMRNYFRFMARLYPGRWFPLKSSTQVIRIPPRPFLKFATTKKMEKKYTSEWNKAVQAAVSGRKF